MLTRTIRAALRDAGIPDTGDHLLCAVSGGADSICLLHVLSELRRTLGLTLTVAHYNHGLRGREAMADETFVREQAMLLDVPFRAARGNVREKARREKVSLETAARSLRYRFLKRTARNVGAGAIVTAHTLDDQAETVLFRLARGTGTRGLAGMRVTSSAQGFPVIRPMLSIRRQAVERYLSARKLTWREDTSNACRDFTRNRIRHDVLPLLANALNPKITESMGRLATIQADEDDWLQELTDGLMRVCCRDNDAAHLNTAALIPLPRAARRRLWRQWLIANGIEEPDITFKLIENLDSALAQQKTTRRRLPDNSTVIFRYGRVEFHAAAPAAIHSAATEKWRIPLAGHVRLHARGLRVSTQAGSKIVRPRAKTPGELPAVASLSRRAIGRRHLYLRSWQAGDRIAPLGMRGSRKLQDIFVDAKIPVEERHHIPIVECGGEIVWIPGYRIARRWEVQTGDPIVELRIQRL